MAEESGLDAHVLDRADFGGFSVAFDRARYSVALAEILSSHRVDVVAMAGFGTVLTNVFHESFPGRVLNTHPSLLPDFKGWHAVRAALDAGVTESGCTVHVATEALDDGPILAQRRVAVRENDTEESLHERIKAVERSLYPQVILRVLSAIDQGHPLTSVAESA